MRRYILFAFIFLLSITSVLAQDYTYLVESKNIQNQIDEVAFRILNANQIPKRVVFVYGENEKKSILKLDTLTKRQVVVFGNVYKSIETVDELAAFIAREIPMAVRSYQGIGSGWLSSVKIKAAPKKYELLSDKMAVDLMVKAGYNPIGLIILINKTCPQNRQDKFSTSNLTSKRLALIYEHIMINYPYFLVKNSYIANQYYQNFLLTSVYNRKMLEIKMRTNSREKLKYE